jgi:hypothetical protein
MWHRAHQHCARLLTKQVACLPAAGRWDSAKQALFIKYWSYKFVLLQCKFQRFDALRPEGGNSTVVQTLM